MRVVFVDALWAVFASCGTRNAVHTRLMELV
jgi:hypothetical protein